MHIFLNNRLYVFRPESHYLLDPQSQQSAAISMCTTHTIAFHAEIPAYEISLQSCTTSPIVNKRGPTGSLQSEINKTNAKTIPGPGFIALPVLSRHDGIKPNLCSWHTLCLTYLLHSSKCSHIFFENYL